MGGMHGFGPVRVERDEPVFHHRWEGRVRALMGRTVARYYNLDEFRHAIEKMPAEDYLRATYYEKWLHAVESLLIEKGVVTVAELRGETRPTASAVAELVAEERPPLQARFRAGQRVRAKTVHPKGHTRLARYVRGKVGVVRTVNGPFLLPDANAHGIPGRWQPCYAVAFTATELWGADAVGPGEEADNVCIDLWESYLEEESE